MKKLSVKDIEFNKTLSYQEDAIINYENQLIKRYGIIESFDSQKKEGYEEENRVFLSVTTQYKSLREYRSNIKFVLKTTEFNQIPKDMDEKLLITKTELEKANMLSRFAYEN